MQRLFTMEYNTIWNKIEHQFSNQNKIVYLSYLQYLHNIINHEHINYKHHKHTSTLDFQIAHSYDGLSILTTIINTDSKKKNIFLKTLICETLNIFVDYCRILT